MYQMKELQVEKCIAICREIHLRAKSTNVLLSVHIFYHVSVKRSSVPQVGQSRSEVSYIMVFEGTKSN